MAARRRRSHRPKHVEGEERLQRRGDRQFDQLRGRGDVGGEATLEAARCYRALGNSDAARAALLRASQNTPYAHARRRHELDAMTPAAARKAAPAHAADRAGTRNGAQPDGTAASHGDDRAASRSRRIKSEHLLMTTLDEWTAAPRARGDLRARPARDRRERERARDGARAPRVGRRRSRRCSTRWAVVGRVLADASASPSLVAEVVDALVSVSPRAPEGGRLPRAPRSSKRSSPRSAEIEAERVEEAWRFPRCVVRFDESTAAVAASLPRRRRGRARALGRRGRERPREDGHSPRARRRYRARARGARRRALGRGHRPRAARAHRALPADAFLIDCVHASACARLATVWLACSVERWLGEPRTDVVFPARRARRRHAPERLRLRRLRQPRLQRDERHRQRPQRRRPARDERPQHRTTARAARNSAATFRSTRAAARASSQRKPSSAHRPRPSRAAARRAEHESGHAQRRRSRCCARCRRQPCNGKPSANITQCTTGPNAVCDANCQSIEEYFSKGDGTTTSDAKAKVRPQLVWPVRRRAIRAGSSASGATNLAAGGTEVAMRVLADDMQPVHGPRAVRAGQLVPHARRAKRRLAAVGYRPAPVQPDDRVDQRQLLHRVRGRSGVARDGDQDALARSDPEPAASGSGADQRGSSNAQTTPSMAANGNNLFVAWEDGTGKIVGTMVASVDARAGHAADARHRARP